MLTILFINQSTPLLSVEDFELRHTRSHLLEHTRSLTCHKPTRARTKCSRRGKTNPDQSARRESSPSPTCAASLLTNPPSRNVTQPQGKTPGGVCVCVWVGGSFVVLFSTGAACLSLASFFFGTTRNFAVAMAASSREAPAAQREVTMGSVVGTRD